MTLTDIIPTLRASLPHPLEPWLWPATTHHVPGGDLSVSGVSVTGIADEFGTPCYVPDIEEFRSRCRRYRAAFPDGAVAHVGKALLTRAVACIVDEDGLLLDVCSNDELALARSVGFPGTRLILHGNANTPQLLRDALDAGVGRIVIDSLDEIELLAAPSVGRETPIDVLLRLTAGVDAHMHRAITTGTEDKKFGLSISSGAAAQAVRTALQYPQLRLLGLHCHLGSQISSTSPYEHAAWRLVACLAEIRDRHDLVLPELNLGGGHGIAYHPGDVPLVATDVARALRHAMAVACRDHDNPIPQLVVEPGRAIAGPLD